MLYNITFEEGYLKLGEDGRGRRLILIKREDIEELEKTYKYLARINTYLRYQRDTIGEAFVKKEDINKVDLLEVGFGAFGQAGRLGEWKDYLIGVKEDTIIKVRPSGAWKDSEIYFLVFENNQVKRIDLNVARAEKINKGEWIELISAHNRKKRKPKTFLTTTIPLCVQGYIEQTYPLDIKIMEEVYATSYEAKQIAEKMGINCEVSSEDIKKGDIVVYIEKIPPIEDIEKMYKNARIRLWQIEIK